MKTLAKRVSLYISGLALVSVIILSIHYFNDLLIRLIPNYPQWITVILSSDLVVTICMFIWMHLKKVDLLKYEFITTVTHKFRTPLTGIKWATENLNNSKLSPSDIEQVGYIKSSNEKLVELTNLLVTTSETERGQYKYLFTKNNISQAAEEVLSSIKNQIQTKQLKIVNDLDHDIYTKCDLTRIKFVMQTFIENAIHYTKSGGTIYLKLKNNKSDFLFSVHDTGIGIKKEELAFIFSKFYRTQEAKKTDTGGMGVGLFISKEIILRHGGKIWAESEGLDKGSTFNFSLHQK